MTKTLAFIALLSAGCVPKVQYDQLQQEYRQLKKQANAMANAQREIYDELKTALQGPIDRGLLELTLDDRGWIVLSLSADVLFASGSATLSADGKRELQQLGRVLSRSSDRPFQVEGHTDNQPITTEQFPSNWHLGSARAIVVVETLIEAGVRPQQLSASTYANYRPAVRRDKDANRRIEIVIPPNLTELPGYERLLKDVNGE